MHTLKLIITLLLFSVVVSTTAQIDSIVVVQGDSSGSFILNAYSDDVIMNDGNVFGKVIKGTASFYSVKFEGRKTASGEIFRNAKFTGASNNFKLNTWVRVTNLSNKKRVVVKINDRMHQRMKQRGRIIDLSNAAAKKIGITHRGLAKVEIEMIKRPNSPKKLKR